MQTDSAEAAQLILADYLTPEYLVHANRALKDGRVEWVSGEIDREWGLVPVGSQNGPAAYVVFTDTEEVIEGDPAVL